MARRCIKLFRDFLSKEGALLLLLLLILVEDVVEVVEVGFEFERVVVERLGEFG